MNRLALYIRCAVHVPLIHTWKSGKMREIKNHIVLQMNQRDSVRVTKNVHFFFLDTIEILLHTLQML